MCGRFLLTIDEITAIAKRFGILERFLKIEWIPHYNIAPTQQCLTVIVEENKPHLVPMSWGFIPHWSKDKKSGYSLINARAESVKIKPAFRESFQRRRCLVPADGFFEWRKTPQGKIPFCVRLKNEEIFAFAGLWDQWTSEEGESIKSFTILTCQSNALVANLHDRMPVILKRENEDAWLDPSVRDPEKLEPLLSPYPDREMKMYEVSSVVNSWKNDTDECVRPI